MTSSADGAGRSARRVLVLLNPGTGRQTWLPSTLKDLRARGGPNLGLVVPDPTDQEEQLREAKAVVEQGVDAVVVFGGDGMVGLGVNLVAQREIPLGIVPTGSGNDFARAADIPRRHAHALHRVLQALTQHELPVRRVDAMRLKVSRARSSQSDTGPSADCIESADVLERNDNPVRVLWVANSVNIGFDAQVNQRANAQRRVPRKLRYLVALAQEVPQFRAVEFVLQLDSGPGVRQKSSLVCIQNGSSIGGGIPLAPRARIDDGWAEVSHIEPLSRAGMVTLFPVLMLRMHRLLKPLTTRQIRHVRVEVPPQVPVFADGEELHSERSSVAVGTVVEATLIPGAVLIVD
ncbi:diacylglycerol/lipid kinase family protein [Nesterenkonia natronophila]|uniref:diacylglycerol/lipid kinase family protein n=1 Tax=Nesterenkonia natronophila TaxID=2174932 RepID=UPI001314B202|nr:diacylglycerol kinase family protein [Nesterenkonia natronophila]